MKSHEVLDTALNNKRLLVPRVVDGSLWVLLNDVREEDSTHSYYTLTNMQDGTVRQLLLPDTTARKNYIVEFFIEKNRIILVDLVSILVFEHDNGSVWTLAEEFPLTYTACYARKDGSVIHLWNDIPSSYSAHNSRTYFYAFDLATKRELPVVELPEPVGVEMMYVQPRNVLDRTANTIVLADVTRYAIRVYSTDTAVVDTVERQSADWKPVENTAAIPAGTPNVQKHFPALVRQAKSACLISRVTLMNDTTLLVVWSTPSEDEPIGYRYSADLWKKANGTWGIDRQDIPMGKAHPDSAFSLTEAPPDITYAYSNGVFLNLEAYSPSFDIARRWRNRAELTKETDRYFATHPLQYIVVERELMP